MLNNTKPVVLIDLQNSNGTLSFIRNMEQAPAWGVVTEYFGDYVQNENASQATHLRGCSSHGCVAAWLLFCNQFPWGEAKREYVLAWKAYQSEQTQKSPGVGACNAR